MVYEWNKAGNKVVREGGDNEVVQVKAKRRGEGESESRMSKTRWQR